MSVTNGQQFRDEWVRLWAPDADPTATAFVDSMLQQCFDLFDFCPDAGATTNSSVMVDSGTLVPIIITSVKVSLTANATVDNTNNAIFSLVFNNGNGGADTTIATVTTNAAATGINGGNNAVKDTPYTVPITAANSRVPAGSALYWKVTKGGGGGLAVTNGSSFSVKARPIQ